MKTILSLIVVTVLVSSMAFSQSGGSAAVDAVFNVSTPLAIPVAVPGDFGDLAPGTNYTILSDGTISPADAAGATFVVPIEWDLAGQPGANVAITFALPPYFTSLTGARVPYAVNTQSAGWSAFPYGVGSPYNPIDPRVDNSITLIGGTATVQLGGLLNVPLGADGSYSAQFVLTAAYTGL
jgi:hypothetical protein